MNKVAVLLTACLLAALSAVLLVVPQFAATQSQQPMDHNSATASDSVPAFHAQPPAGELPPTMAPSLFNDPIVFNAYAVAARVKKVLYQQPCYCHCDQSHGHASLLDCFASRHGSGCGTCIKEVFYSYEQTHAGKTPTQIREGVIRGDWQKVDLAKYQTALPAPDAPVK
jgi:hypothetical protein